MSTEANRAKELAEAHWNGYVKPLLYTHGQSDTLIALVEFHYQTAFIHGYKHATEDNKPTIHMEEIKVDLPLPKAEPTLCDDCGRGCKQPNITHCGVYIRD